MSEPIITEEHKLAHVRVLAGIRQRLDLKSEIPRTKELVPRVRVLADELIANEIGNGELPPGTKANVYFTEAKAINVDIVVPAPALQITILDESLPSEDPFKTMLRELKGTYGQKLGAFVGVRAATMIRKYKLEYIHGIYVQFGIFAFPTPKRLKHNLAYMKAKSDATHWIEKRITFNTTMQSFEITIGIDYGD